MIVAVVSDSHLNPRTKKPFPDRLFFECAQADLIVHAGDWHGLEGYEFFCGLGPPVVGVLGNGDMGTGLELPEIVNFEFAEVGFHVRHVRPEVKVPGDVVIFGHSHRPVLEHTESQIWLNPGHVCPKRWKEPPPSMAMLRIDNGSVSDVEVFDL